MWQTVDQLVFVNRLADLLEIQILGFFEISLALGVFLYLHEVAVLLVGLAELVFLVLDYLVSIVQVPFETQILQSQIDQIMFFLNLHTFHL